MSDFLLHLIESTLLWSILLYGMYRRSWFKTDIANTKWWTHHAGFIFLTLIPNPIVGWIGRYIYYDDFHQHTYLQHGKGPLEVIVRSKTGVRIVWGVASLLLFGVIALSYYDTTSNPYLIYVLYALISIALYCPFELINSLYMEKHGGSFLHRLGDTVGLYEYRWRLGVWLEKTRWAKKYSSVMKLANFLQGP